MTAIALSLVAVLGFGSATVFARLGMARVGPMPLIFVSLCVSLLASGILAAAFASHEFIVLPLIVLAWCLLLGAFNFLGGRNLSYLAVGRIGAARAAAIVGTSAVFASILAIVFTGERPHWVVLLGTLVVVAGLAAALGRNIVESAGNRGSTGRAALLGYLLAFGAATCYGTTNVVVKQLTIDTSPLVISTISLFFGVLLVAPVAAKTSCCGPARGEAVACLPWVRSPVGAGLGHGRQLYLFCPAASRRSGGLPHRIGESLVHPAAGIAVSLGPGERQPMAGAGHHHHCGRCCAGRVGQHTVTGAGSPARGPVA